MINHIHLTYPGFEKLVVMQPSKQNVDLSRKEIENLFGVNAMQRQNITETVEIRIIKERIETFIRTLLTVQEESYEKGFFDIQIESIECDDYTKMIIKRSRIETTDEFLKRTRGI